MKEPKIRKIVTNLEEVFYEGGAEKPVETNSGRKSIKTVSVAAVIKNPYAGQWVEDLSELTEYGEYLGDLLTKKGAELLGAENVETYGKGCIVGLDGELEHSSAMLHPKSGKTIRAAIGGGKSIIPSNEKVGPAGSELDISLHFKDAAFVRTHYGSFAVRIPDAPKSDEIVMAVVRMLSSTALAVSAVCRSPKPSARTACTNSSPRLTIAPLATRGLFSRA